MIDVAYSLKLVTGPTAWVADVADVRKWGRMPDDSLEDSLILDQIKAATEVMEVLANRVFCTQTLEMRLDAFPSDGVIQLPKGPWQAIVSVIYREPNAGVLTTISSADYILEETTGVLTTAVGVSWPDTQERIGAVRIQYTAGYGDAPAACPTICKRAVILGVIDELENRNGRYAVPMGVRQKLEMIWPGTI